MKVTTITLWCLTLLMAPALWSQIPHSFAIHPETVVVQAGSTVRFTAVEQGSPSDSFTPSAIMWKAQGGRIDEIGTFTAGKVAGTFPIYASTGNLKAQATVQVIAFEEEPKNDHLQGWIYVRRWRLRPQKGANLELYVKTVINGQTVKTARLFLVNNKGDEKLLEVRKTHHRRREHWKINLNHVGWQWVDIRAYDHLGRVVAQVRRPI